MVNLMVTNTIEIIEQWHRLSLTEVGTLLDSWRFMGAIRWLN